MRYDAIVFDLLSGLLDSWSLWDSVAGDQATGRRWRNHYLQHTYATAAYRPYETLVAEAAEQAQLPSTLAETLLARWDELTPWPEAPAVLQTLAAAVPLAVVTNCSEALGARAIARTGGTFTVAVTAERAGYYKPDPHPYRLALAELRVAPERALFVAGSPFDIPGASGVGQPVVWHNRLNLPLPTTGPAPQAIYPTLQPLLDLLAEHE